MLRPPQAANLQLRHRVLHFNCAHQSFRCQTLISFTSLIRQHVLYCMHGRRMSLGKWDRKGRGGEQENRER